MARPGVTYSDIATAAATVQGQGKNPTVENIRAVLGTGSIGTINNHLRQWKLAQATTNNLATKEAIPTELVAMLKGLWERVDTLAQDQISEMKTKFTTELSSANDEAVKYKTNNQRWQQMYNQWQQEKSALSTANISQEAVITQLTQQLRLSDEQKNILQMQFDEKHQRINELNQLHQLAQQNLEHYRNASREQRIIDQQQFSEQKQLLLTELKAITATTNLQREQLATLQVKLQTLQRSHNDAEENCLNLAANLKELHLTFRELEKAKQEAQLASDFYQNKFQESDQILKTVEAKHMELHVRVKSLEQQFMQSELQLKESQDQNKLLAQDKWMLANEKAQLEGQLRQMQKMLVTE